MTDKIVLDWSDDAYEPYTQPVKVYWDEDEVSEVEFFIHKSLLMMRTNYSNLQGVLQSNWCLGFFNKPEDAIPYAQFVMDTYCKHSNLKECPSVVYVEWDGADAYDLKGELITSDYFYR